MNGGKPQRACFGFSFLIRGCLRNCLRRLAKISATICSCVLISISAMGTFSAFQSLLQVAGLASIEARMHSSMTSSNTACMKTSEPNPWRAGEIAPDDRLPLSQAPRCPASWPLQQPDLVQSTGGARACWEARSPPGEVAQYSPIPPGVPVHAWRRGLLRYGVGACRTRCSICCSLTDHRRSLSRPPLQRQDLRYSSCSARRVSYAPRCFRRACCKTEHLARSRRRAPHAYEATYRTTDEACCALCSRGRAA